MHVLHLGASGSLGGAERSLLDIVASVRQGFPEWRLSVVCGGDGGLVARAAALGADVRVLPYGGPLAHLGEAGSAGRAALAARLAASAPQTVGYVRALRRTIAELDPDVVHAHGLKMHVLSAWAVAAAAPRRPRLVWHLHDYVGSRPLTSRLLRWSVRHCDAIVANSASVADDVRRALVPAAPVTVVHNAVDLDRFTPEGNRLDLDRLAGLPPAPPGTVRVGLVAAFGRWKGHTTFLDALARVKAPQVRAYVVGGPLYRTAGSQLTVDELRAHAAANGLAGRVGFTGFVEAPDEAMRALDVVVHASTAPEPFGLVIAEAMACGRAVIASDGGGAREVFTAGVDALAHTPGDPASLAACIARLAADRDLRAALGRAGRLAAEQRFNRRRLAGELAPLYRAPLRAAS